MFSYIASWYPNNLQTRVRKSWTAFWEDLKDEENPPSPSKMPSWKDSPPPGPNSGDKLEFRVPHSTLPPSQVRQEFIPPTMAKSDIPAGPFYKSWESAKLENESVKDSQPPSPQFNWRPTSPPFQWQPSTPVTRKESHQSPSKMPSWKDSPPTCLNSGDKLEFRVPHATLPPSQVSQEFIPTTKTESDIPAGPFHKSSESVKLENQSVKDSQPPSPQFNWQPSSPPFQWQPSTTVTREESPPPTQTRPASPFKNPGRADSPPTLPPRQVVNHPLEFIPPWKTVQSVIPAGPISKPTASGNLKNESRTDSQLSSPQFNSQQSSPPSQWQQSSSPGQRKDSPPPIQTRPAFPSKNPGRADSPPTLPPRQVVNHPMEFIPPSKMVQSDIPAGPNTKPMASGNLKNESQTDSKLPSPQFNSQQSSPPFQWQQSSSPGQRQDSPPPIQTRPAYPSKNPGRADSPPTLPPRQVVNHPLEFIPPWKMAQSSIPDGPSKMPSRKESLPTCLNSGDKLEFRVPHSTLPPSQVRQEFIPPTKTESDIPAGPIYKSSTSAKLENESAKDSEPPSPQFNWRPSSPPFRWQPTPVTREESPPPVQTRPASPSKMPVLADSQIGTRYHAFLRQVVNHPLEFIPPWKTVQSVIPAGPNTKPMASGNLKNESQTDSKLPSPQFKSQQSSPPFQWQQSSSPGQRKDSPPPIQTRPASPSKIPGRADSSPTLSPRQVVNHPLEIIPPSKMVQSDIPAGPNTKPMASGNLKNESRTDSQLSSPQFNSQQPSPPSQWQQSSSPGQRQESLPQIQTRPASPPKIPGWFQPWKSIPRMTSMF